MEGIVSLGTEGKPKARDIYFIMFNCFYKESININQIVNKIIMKDRLKHLIDMILSIYNNKR